MNTTSNHMKITQDHMKTRHNQVFNKRFNFSSQKQLSPRISRSHAVGQFIGIPEILRNKDTKKILNGVMGEVEYKCKNIYKIYDVMCTCYM